MQPDGVAFETEAQPRGETEMHELARLADSLVQQLAETRQHYERLRTDLDSYEASSDTPPSAPEEHEETPEESQERIRLFALNLALSGHSREDVILELREQFGVTDASDILDAVFPDTNGGPRKRRFGRRKEK